MKSCLIVFLSVVLAGCFAALGDVSERDYLEMVYNVPLLSMMEVNADTVPDIHKGNVFAALRQEHVYVGKLMRLNDQETIDDVVEKLKKEDVKNSGLIRVIENSSSPYVIDDLAPLLYVEEISLPRFWVVGSTGHSDEGQSSTIAMVIAHIVANEPLFSDDVRKSAIDLRERVDCVLVMRDWWEKNSQALMRNDFRSVSVINNNLISDKQRKLLIEKK